MPDNDPLESLDNFSEGLHVNALPASEVRRRGDRMRRRNTALATVGGVVAAAVFIGVPVALVSANDRGDDIDPAPQPTPTVTEDGEPQWLTEIPEEFPLADGFPETNGLDGSPTEVVTEGVSVAPLELCGTSWPGDGLVDAHEITYSGESEDTGSRQLLLYDNDEVAPSLTALREAVQACPNQPTEGGDSVLLSSLVDLDLGTEDSVVIAKQVQFDDGLISDLTVTEVARSGNAIWIETSYGSAAGPDVIEFETERLRERAAVPLGAMCVFSADPCETGSAPVTTDPSNVTSTNPPASGIGAAIPADFPLADGLRDGGDIDVEGPGPDVESAPVVDVCGAPVFQASGALDRLVVRASGPEYLETRELVTFVTADEPSEAITQVREAVASCAGVGDQQTGFETRTLNGADGYDSFTWGAFAVEGLGGWVFQLTRVGSALLVVYTSGEMSESSLQPAADNLTETTLALVPEMCVFTEDGC